MVYTNHRYLHMDDTNSHCRIERSPQRRSSRLRTQPWQFVVQVGHVRLFFNSVRHSVKYRQIFNVLTAHFERYDVHVLTRSGGSQSAGTPDVPSGWGEFVLMLLMPGACAMQRR